jgi:hypothetical protein
VLIAETVAEQEELYRFDLSNKPPAPVEQRIGGATVIRNSAGGMRYLDSDDVHKLGHVPIKKFEECDEVEIIARIVRKRVPEKEAK